MKNILIATVFTMSSTVAVAQGPQLSNPVNTPTPTIDSIRKLDKVSCIVNADGVGFSWAGSTGKFQGMQIDFCKALAASVLKDSEKYATIPTVAKDQMITLINLNGDVLIRTFPKTLYREMTLPIVYTNEYFNDVQAMAVRKSSNIKKKEDLNGVTVCIQQGSLSEQRIATWFRQNNMKFTQVTFGDPNTTLDAFKTGRCDVFTLDRAFIGIEMRRAGIEDYEILPVDVARTVYGVAVRQDDLKWAAWTRSIIDALIYAEEYGITKDNVDQIKASSQDPNVKRLLGVEGDFHTKIGLDSDWAVRAIKAVGNYGEIYDRWFVEYAKVPRGVNKLCKNGGQICPPAFQ
jgi:general L-amino acid transport system substrate-binding protein